MNQKIVWRLRVIQIDVVIRWEGKTPMDIFFKYLKVPISLCSKKQTVVALSSCEA